MQRLVLTRSTPLLAMLALTACAGARPPVAAPPTHDEARAQRQMAGEEFRVVGRTNGEGDAYDAAMLFDRATALVREHHCAEAVEQYDRLLREFPTARVVPVAQFNRGVCLQSMQRWDDAVGAFRVAATTSSERDLRRDAWFRIATVAGNMSPQRPALAIEAAEQVLTLQGASITDRVEAFARIAVARLALNERPAATRAAEQAIALAPTRESINALDDDTYAAQARFVLAEVTRAESVEVQIVVDDPNLEAAIERRVNLVMHAHVQFNDAINVGNPHWSAASGFRIGEIYGELYNSIVNAPVPADWEQPAIAVYRRRTSQRLRPLLTGAMRAWEATLAMARRTGIQDNEWVRRADQQLQTLRDMILNNGSGSTATPAPPRTGTGSGTGG